MGGNFFRPQEFSREPRLMPASTYNLARSMLLQSGSRYLLVPIRPLSYLAILDGEEIVFVGREGGNLIEIAWQGFRPQQRRSLEDAVAFEAVYYAPAAPLTVNSLEREFHRALQELAARVKRRESAKVIEFRSKK
ncbi:MAG: hypothetical protein AB1710_09230 [Pseudomonadota bacterium]